MAQSQRTKLAHPIGWLVEQVRTFGMEAIFGLYPGIYRAQVIDNADPQKRGRVRAICPALGQEDAADVPKEAWALPVQPGSVGSGGIHGLFWPPDVGDHIWMMFEAGDLTDPVYIGGWWTKYEKGTELADEKARVKGLRTASGHLLTMSDVDGKREVRLAKGKDGDTTGTEVRLEDDGTVVIQTAKGHIVRLSDGQDKSVTVEAANGAKAVLDGSTLKLSLPSGDAISMESGRVKLSANAEIVLEAPSIKLNGQQVALGSGASEPAVKGAALANAWQLHTHGTAAPGSPTVPGSTTPPVLVGSHLSTIVKVA